MNIPHGSDALIKFTGELRETAPHVPQAYDLRKAEQLMNIAAIVIERLAPLESDIDAHLGEE